MDRSGYAAVTRSQTSLNTHQLLPSMHANGNGSALAFAASAKILLLARCIDINANTHKQCEPSAYRVLELKGVETYPELVELVGDRLGFHKEPGRAVRSIQVHDESGVTQIVLDGDTALEYILGQLKRDVELRMTVYAIPNNTWYDSNSRNAAADELARAAFDPSATPVYARGQNSKDQENYNPYTNVHNGRASGYDDDHDIYSHDSYERGRNHRPSITPPRQDSGACNRLSNPDRRRMSRSTSPQYRPDQGSYRQRDYGRENDPRGANAREMSGSVPEKSEPRDSPMSPPRFASPIPGRQQTAAIDDPSRVDVDTEDVEIAGPARAVTPNTLAPSAEPIETRPRTYSPSRSHGGSRDKAVTKRPYRRLPGFGRDNSIPGRDRPSQRSPSGPDPWWAKVRFCDLWISDAGKDNWSRYGGDHLRVRVSTSCAFQSTYDNVLNELFHRDLTVESRGRNVPRKPGFVFMLYMRILQRPLRGAPYEADGDVGVLINGKNIIPGSLKWNWDKEVLYLRFRINGDARVIHRQTPQGHPQDQGTPEANGNCNMGVNFLICPRERAQGKNWEAIQAMWSRLVLGKESEFIIHCSRSQLTLDAWETISTYEQAEYAPISEFNVETTTDFT
ncbi:hypothetical protein TWF696_006857 [Orbilia brochopaga]|uniref:Uncharacterized protein n=1 Tax=Orbilia brochopaga TaxID=3140254 RepID=A0AAV9UWB8_9PEZI